MDLTQLDYFLSVARTQHYTKSSEELNVSQSTISMALGKLEDEVGAPLFEKVGRRKMLTPAGAVFKTYVEQANKNLQLAMTEAQLASKMEQATIQIATDSIEAITPGEIAFLKRTPHFNIRQFSTTTDRVISSLISQQIHFGITHIPPAEDEIVSTPILSERIGLLVSANHPLAGRKQIRLKELSEESFVTLQYGTSYWHMVDGFFRNADFTPRIVLESLDMHMLYRAVENNIGVAFLSDGGWHQNWELNTEQRKNSFCLIPIEDSICTRTFYISTLRNRPLPQGAWYLYVFLCEFYEGIEHDQKKFRESIGWI